MAPVLDGTVWDQVPWPSKTICSVSGTVLANVVVLTWTVVVVVVVLGRRGARRRGRARRREPADLVAILSAIFLNTSSAGPSGLSIVSRPISWPVVGSTMRISPWTRSPLRLSSPSTTKSGPSGSSRIGVDGSSCPLLCRSSSSAPLLDRLAGIDPADCAGGIVEERGEDRTRNVAAEAVPDVQRDRSHRADVAATGSGSAERGGRQPRIHLCHGRLGHERHLHFRRLRAVEVERRADRETHLTFSLRRRHHHLDPGRRPQRDATPLADAGRGDDLARGRVGDPGASARLPLPTSDPLDSDRDGRTRHVRRSTSRRAGNE